MSNDFPKKPQGIEVEHFNNYIRIKYNWSNTGSWGSIIVGLVSFIIVVFLLFLWIKEGDSLATSVTFYIIPFIFIGIGMFLSVIRSKMDKTSIKVDDKAIIIRKPLSPTNDFAIRIIKLTKIFSKVETEIIEGVNESTTITRFYQDGITTRYYGGKSTRYRYKVYARTSYNTNKKIIETNNRAQMLFIEKTLKDYLNMTNESQENEVN